MKVLIRQARVIDPASPLNGQRHDIFIENGIIREIGPGISVKGAQIISGDDLHVSPGWVDVFANFADPGFEYKETLVTGASAAAAGGFTDVMIIPNTNPVIHNKSGIEYIVQKASTLPVNIHPVGAITKNAEGKELAEMYDMRSSGALAFSDGLHCVQSAGLLVKALQYVKPFDGIIIQLPDDKSINPHGLVNEGLVSTRLGLPGKPSMAEELIIARDIKLAQYAASRIHFTGISSGRSVEYIRRAKKEGIDVSCSVTPYHLLFSDDDLSDYDTNLKVNPPLRTKEDRKALMEAVADGTIDCIATHHMPHEYDSKVSEFEYARFGMTGLETAYSVLKMAMPEVQEEKWIEMLSVNPRKLFGLPEVSITENVAAAITLFDPVATWKVGENGFRSRSKNTPFTGMNLKGKLIGIINKEQLFLNT